MFDSIENKPTVNIKNPIPFRDKYPSFTISITSVQLEEISSDGDWCWLNKSHKKITINNGEFVGVIINGISGMIKEGEYQIWYSFSDHHNRFIEIVLADKVTKIV